MQDINTINTGLCQAGRQASDQKVNTGGQTRGAKYQSSPGSRQAKGGSESQLNKAGMCAFREVLPD